MSRISDIYRGILVYDQKREFSTDATNKINFIKRIGDIENYTKKTLKMIWVGTNRQGTGIYAQSNETIIIYVKSENDNDLLPKIQFSQYIGTSRNWLSSSKKNLKIGKNIFNADDFKIPKNFSILTYPGGPIYLSNPYDSSQQGIINIYIEGGVVFPTFNLNGNSTVYIENLSKWIDLVKMDNKKYPDITEFYSKKLMLTVKASDAYEIYSKK